MDANDIQKGLKEIAPSVSGLARTAENTVIRRVIWGLPKPVVWVLAVLIVVLAVVYGGK